MRFLVPITSAALLIVACQQQPAATPVLEESVTSSSSSESSYESSSEVSDGPQLPAVIPDPNAASLLESLEQAKAVEQAMQLAIRDYGVELDTALMPLLERFTSDIANLEQFVTLAQTEPLLEEDTATVTDLVNEIDEAIGLFDSILTLLSTGSEEQGTNRNAVR